MVNTVSYEDVRMAVSSIAQAASNILVAVNGPLLDRGQVLHLDYDRANMLPPDYESDIETVWSNPNAFADGDDFSWDTMQKNRNKYYQQQGSNQVIQQVEDTLVKAVGALSFHMNIGQSNVIDTPSIAMVTEKVVFSELNSRVLTQPGGSQITLPALPYCSLAGQVSGCSDVTPVTINVRPVCFPCECSC